MALSHQTAADVLRLSVAKLGPAFKVAANFILSELRSRDGSDTVLAHPALLLLLARIRRRAQRPVVVTSGYRTPERNRQVGGAPNSLHTQGMAADIKIPGLSVEEVARIAEQVGAGGIGLYHGHVHVDVGPPKRWDDR